MFKRLDVSFSETNSSTGGLPSIHLTKKIFTYGLALSDDLGRPVFDETIYKPEAFLVGKKTINGITYPINTTIKIDKCDINDFGENFKKFTTSMDLNKYYCFKNFDVDFEGYIAAENFTTIIINIKKCVGTTKEGIPCKNDSEIYNSMNRKNLQVFSEDFDLTPFDYERPVKEKFTLNSCPIRLNQFQTFVGYYQLANLQTENNLFGFEAFSDIKSEKYLIYHSALIMSYEMIPGQQEVLTYNIMLKEKIEKIIGVICALVADILYDKTMVNNLFSFDLNNYTINIKKKHAYNIKDINGINTSYLNNEKNDIKYNKKEINVSKSTTRKSIDNRKQKFNPKKSSFPENNSIIYNNGNSERINNLKNFSSVRILKKSAINPPKLNQEYFDEIEIYNYDKPSDNKIIDQRKIIKKIETNLLCTYFCFCIVRKRENFGNVLLNEAMNIITEKLDIYNMFRNFYFVVELKTKWNYEYKDLEMSDECKSKLKKVSDKILDSFYRF